MKGHGVQSLLCKLHLLHKINVQDEMLRAPLLTLSFLLSFAVHANLYGQAKTPCP